MSGDRADWDVYGTGYYTKHSGGPGGGLYYIKTYIPLTFINNKPECVLGTTEVIYWTDGFQQGQILLRCQNIPGSETDNLYRVGIYNGYWLYFERNIAGTLTMLKTYILPFILEGWQHFKIRIKDYTMNLFVWRDGDWLYIGTATDPDSTFLTGTVGFDAIFYTTTWENIDINTEV